MGKGFNKKADTFRVGFSGYGLKNLDFFGRWSCYFVSRINYSIWYFGIRWTGSCGRR